MQFCPVRDLLYLQTLLKSKKFIPSETNYIGFKLKASLKFFLKHVADTQRVDKDFFRSASISPKSVGKNTHFIASYA